MSFQDNHEQCKICGEKYMSKYDAKYEWCKPCQINNLKINFTNRTSGNEKIDNLIQEMQLKISKPDDRVFEWISYNQFNNIKGMGDDGLVKVYSAIWKDGPLDYNKSKNEYIRNPNKKVALKLYNNSQNIIDEFFNDQVNKFSL